MAASAASPAHQGRLVLAAVLAGGLIVLGLVFARRYLNAKKKSSSSTEETVAKKEEENEVNEVIAQEEVKKVEAIKEESEPEAEAEPKSEPEQEPKSESAPAPEPEPIAAAKPESTDTHSSTLKVELKSSERRGVSVSPARLLPSPTPESAPVQETIESTEVKATESAPPAASASAPESEPAPEEPEEESAEAEEAASSGPAEDEPTQADEGKEEDEEEEEEPTEQKSAKDTLIRSTEFKLDPEAQPFMPRDSSLIQQFAPSDGSIVSEIISSGMGGESLAEPIEKEADLEDLSDEGAVASSEVESESLSMEMVELKEAAAAIVSGPQSAKYVMEEQPISTGSNYVVIDTDQANNNSVSPELSECEQTLSVGQYDDAEENQKAADHDLNSDSPFDFFDLATSPNDFKPSFDFVDPNENPIVQRGSEEDIEVISDQKDEDEDQYIPDMSLEDVESESPRDFSADDISAALDAANNNPSSIGTRQLEVLVSLILSKDYDIQQAAMAGVVKCAAFTDNQNSLRELGCHKKLAILLKSYVMSMKVGYIVSAALISSVANAVSNMSVNEKNQIVLQETVPLLVDLTVESEMKESALLSTLRALTNLSTTERHHGQYTRMVQHLYNLMDAGSTPVKLQALKVLVNLSCSAEMVQHLLAAKAPHSVLELLQQDAEEALVLRWTTLLANIVHTVRVNKMSQSSLPCPEKAASPETMYTAVYGVQSMGDLKSKIFLLSKHKNEDIRYQAARVYSGLVR